MQGVECYLKWEGQMERERNTMSHWWNLFSVILFYLCKIFRKGTQKFKIKLYMIIQWKLFYLPFVFVLFLFCFIWFCFGFGFRLLFMFLVFVLFPFGFVVLFLHSHLLHSCETFYILQLLCIICHGFLFHSLLCFAFFFNLLSCLCILRLLSDNFILLCCTNISNENQHRWRWRRCTFPFNNIIYIAYNYCCNYNCLEYI